MSINLPPQDIMETLMQDPVKRALILQLVQGKRAPMEPVKKVKSRPHCESPTAMLQRRALEQRRGASSKTTTSVEETQGPKMPFDQLLKGVVAFVEVNKNGIDRSSGIKTIMTCMGATVRDQFTRDVTHVIFKDGSFTTYEKAKLMRVHMVSVLWLDAVRRHGRRVPEKNYPAFGSEVCDEKVTILCSQLQKDYEDIIMDEKRRSNTKLMSRASSDSYHTALLTNDETCLTSDNDSDCADVLIDGEVDRRYRSPLLTDDATSITTLVPDVPASFPLLKKSLQNLTNDSSTTSDSTTSQLSVQSRKNLSQVTSFTSDDSDGLRWLQRRKKVDSLKTESPLSKSSNSLVNGKNTTLNLEKLDTRQPLSNRKTRASDLSSESTSLLNKRQSRKTVNIIQNVSITPDLMDSDNCQSKLLRSTSTMGVSNAKDKKKLTETVNSSQNMSITPNLSTDIIQSKSKRSSSTMSSLCVFESINKENSINDVVSDPVTNNVRRSSRRSLVAKQLFSQSVKKKTTMRKLYNPDDVLTDLPIANEDDVERARMVQDKTHKNDEVGVFSKNCQVRVELPLPTVDTRPIVSSSDYNHSPRSNGRQKKKKPPVNESFDSDIDEQKDLLEFVTQREKSRKRIRNVSLATPSSNNKRRSTLDFQPNNEGKRKVKNRREISSIVVTKFHRTEVTLCEEIVKELGGFFTELQVSERTTHLIAGESKRTINMLKGIARGCWILTQDWLLKSREAGRWLAEEDFEIRNFSPAVQKCRLERQAFGKGYCMDIFQNCGPIYIGLNTTPPCSVLKELVELCQGHVTTIYRNAAIVVGDFFKRDQLTCVSEEWVLDSIQFYKMKTVKDYLIHDEGLNVTLEASPHF